MPCVKEWSSVILESIGSVQKSGFLPLLPAGFLIIAVKDLLFEQLCRDLPSAYLHCAAGNGPRRWAKFIKVSRLHPFGDAEKMFEDSEADLFRWSFFFHFSTCLLDAPSEHQKARVWDCIMNLYFCIFVVWVQRQILIHHPRGEKWGCLCFPTPKVSSQLW